MSGSTEKFPNGLSNLQLELLRLYSANVSDSTLEQIKLILAKYFAERATDAMDEVWDRDALTPNHMFDWANGHERIEDRP
ncbi:MAG: hypothetical protein QM785_08710 [Pyrinomonadaceae bacterium]